MSAYNGVGTFVISGTGLPVVTATTISSTVANQLNTDLATGLSTAICKDGQTTTTASIPFAVGLSSNALVDISNAAAGQILFPATQNPSANVNTLDDYEEGTWTPVDSSGAGLVYSSVIGKYTKIGNMVSIYGVFTFPPTADGTAALIGGLPFTSANAGTGYLLTALAGGGGGVSIVGFVTKNTTTLSLLDGTGTARTNANNSTRIVQVTGVYFV